MAEIVEPHAEAGLHDAAGQFAQRQLFLRGDFAEKRQRQVQISRRHRPAGLRRKRLGAPADHLLLQGVRQGQGEKQAARIGHGGSVNNDKSVRNRFECGLQRPRAKRDAWTSSVL